MIALILTVFYVLGVISAVHAVMSTRTPQGAIAWLVTLLTVPIVAVPAYWVLGRNRFQGYVVARRDADRDVDPLSDRALENVSAYLVGDDDKTQAAAAAEHLAGLPMLKGNALELLIDGEATFDSILAGLEEARSYILFQFFIVKDDELGRAVQTRLIEKAKQGVRVYFLYDEIGSASLTRSYRDELRAAGVAVSAFNTRQGIRNKFQINFRNHRKVVVVDGQVTWIGGHNVGDEYLGRDPKFGHWRDTHVRIEGPAALAAQISFLEDWRWATGEVLELDWTPKPAPDGDAHVLVMPTGPADTLETASLMFVHAINSAQDRIWIASPYFVPDAAVIAALQLAGLRGVDVRIIIPDKADHLLVYLNAFSYFEIAGRTGVTFHKYMDGFLHQKVMLIDDRAATIGTANFDNRSFRLNFEITAILGAQPDFVAQVEAMLTDDLAKSRPVPADELSRRPFWFRLGVQLARLTAPVQ